MHKFGSWLSLIAAFSMTSCKTPGGSTIKHDLGDTSRVTDTTEFAKCQVSEMTLKKYPKTQAYLIAIAKAVADGNKSTFQGKLALENFCFNVEESPQFNAFANSYSREVFFFTGTLLSLANDAQVAAIMSHELAHVTRLHGRVAHPKFPMNEANQELLKQFDTIQQKIFHLMQNIGETSQKIAQIHATAGGGDVRMLLEDIRKKAMDKFRKSQTGDTAETARPDLPTGASDELVKQHDQLFDKMFQDNQQLGVEFQNRERIRLKLQQQLIVSGTVGLEESHSWEEQNADEVGLEFFLRAGFKGSEFINLQSKLLQLSSSSLDEVSRCLQEAYPAILANSGAEPMRGTNTHPLPCWRIYDTIRESHHTHLNDYKNFLAQNTKISVSASLRNAALAEIHQHMQPSTPSGPSDEQSEQAAP